MLKDVKDDKFEREREAFAKRVDKIWNLALEQKARLDADALENKIKLEAEALKQKARLDTDALENKIKLEAKALEQKRVLIMML